MYIKVESFSLCLVCKRMHIEIKEYAGAFVEKARI